MRAEIDLARVDLKELLDEERLDFGKIKAKVSQMADMDKKMRLARWTLAEKSHDLLTVEQLEKAQMLRKRGAGIIQEGRRQMIKKMIIEETEE
jgi:Spy/CpxP family protein refolding chaperone